MTRNVFPQILYELIGETGAGVLATVDGDGRPHMRWMTPVLSEDQPGICTL